MNFEVHQYAVPIQYPLAVIDSDTLILYAGIIIFVFCLYVFFFKATHISALPMEIILYIFRWVVSSDLDLRSLEMCSHVCRGFYLCSRDPEIWRLACAR